MKTTFSVLFTTNLKAVILPSPAVEYDLQVVDLILVMSFLFIYHSFTVSVHPNPRAFNLFMGMSDVKNVVKIAP